MAALQKQVAEATEKLQQSETRRTDMQTEFDGLRTFKKDNEGAAERLRALGEDYDLDALMAAGSAVPGEVAAPALEPAAAPYSPAVDPRVAAAMRPPDPLSQAVEDTYRNAYAQLAISDPAGAHPQAARHALRYARQLQEKYPQAKIDVGWLGSTGGGGLSEGQVREVARTELREAEEAGQAWELLRNQAFEPLGGDTFAAGPVKFPGPPDGARPEMVEAFRRYEGLEMTRRQAYDVMGQLTGIDDSDILLRRIDPEGVRAVERATLKAEVLGELRKEGLGSMPESAGGPIPESVLAAAEGQPVNAGTARSNEAVRKIGGRVGSDGPLPRTSK